MDADKQRGASARERFLEQRGAKRHSVFSDTLFLARRNKKYWLIPLVLVIMGFGLLLVLGGTGVAPFIYTLF